VPSRAKTVFLGPGEMPVGGPASSSSRRTTQAIAESSALLALQQREYERQKAAADAARKRGEPKQRDPYVYPFEDYYFVDVKSRAVERALALPPGDFDVYVAVIDRAHVKDGRPLVHHGAVTVPDYWDDTLALSSLMLVSSVNTLPAPLKAQQQAEHPYAFGLAEVVPVKAAAFSTGDVLSIVYQICNYGAPDADLHADYAFYSVDGAERRLFNRTAPQIFTDAELPPPSPWETQAFVTQSVPLAPFPHGRYELEVTVRDRLTRGVARQSVTFIVQ
jgi:hypothetical protein